MIDSQTMADHYAISLRNLHRQTNGLTHEQSLMQLPFRGNCMNWTLGHILLCREEIFDILGVPRFFPADTFTRYDSGSPPIVADEAEIIRLDKLLNMLDQQAPYLTEILTTTPDSKYASTVQVGQNTRTLAHRVLFYFFHEANHVGELSILRQLTGVNDKVI